MGKRTSFFHCTVIACAFCVAFAMVVLSCSPQKQMANGKSPDAKVQSTESDDSIQYELLVFDPGFESFLAQLSYPKEFYSDSYYHNWNVRYVQEWNSRCRNPLRYGSFYDTIPYDANTDYGLDFNYRLYHYFLFVEQQYGIVLIPRRGK
ncbi:MAG: DUF6146 family protein [Breznakibacter sp.]